MSCLHTGACVLLSEYGQAVRCDVHDEGNGECRVLNLADGWENFGHRSNGADCHYECWIGNGYFNKTKGIIVVPAADLVRVP